VVNEKMHADGLTMAEIGDKLEISGSVCRILKSGSGRLVCG
jgi:hypothetical protein